MSADLMETLKRAIELLNVQHHARAGVVQTVSGEVCSVKCDQELLKNVRWTFPGKPGPGSKCIVVFRDNSDNRATAIGFDSLDKIEAKVANKWKIYADDQEIILSLVAGSQKVLRVAPDGKVSLGNHTNLEKAARGETLKSWLSDLIDTLTTKPVALDVITGPEMMEPGTIADLIALQAQLGDILSQEVTLS